jgi:phosphoglycerate dehydrogenase-like enzyme
MKAVLQHRASPGLRQRIAALDFPTAIVDQTDKDTFLREMRDADVLLHVLEPVTASVIDATPRLQLIQKIGIGVNTIDLDAARRRGVAVCNMPGTNTQAVAEMTLLLMLATLRRLAYLDALTRAGKGWEFERDLSDDLGELSGRTVGLVGFGAVARRLVPMLQAFGAKLVYTSRQPAADSPIPFLPFPEILPVADVLSLHLPLTAETAGIIGATAFAAMKRGSILINTARGPLVDEEALRDALTSGHLRGAGLDVFSGEPVSPDDPLLELSTVVVTPHLAWLTNETLERSLEVIAENSRRLHTGERSCTEWSDHKIPKHCREQRLQSRGAGCSCSRRISWVVADDRIKHYSNVGDAAPNRSADVLGAGERNFPGSAGHSLRPPASPKLLCEAGMRIEPQVSLPMPDGREVGGSPRSLFDRGSHEDGASSGARGRGWGTGSGLSLEAGMSLPVQVWPVQSLASRTEPMVRGLTAGGKRIRTLGPSPGIF